MARIVRTFRNQDDRFSTLESVAYTNDGKVWYWDSNDAPCPLDSCQSHRIPCDVQAQRDAFDDHIDEMVRMYREAQAADTPAQTAERSFELRATFGPGMKVVGVT